MDFPKFADLQAIGANQILTFNSNITVAAVNRAGSDINIDVAAAAAIGDECIGQLTSVAAGNFIDSSAGTQLDRVLYDRYKLLRNPAAPAVGSVVFQVVNGSNVPIANPTAFAIPTNTVLQTKTGGQFITTAAGVYPQSAAGPITVAVQSVLAGSDQQAAVGTITSIISQIPGGPAAPNSLTVTNTLATAGAADDEQDPAFRARGRSFFTTAQKGTLSAIVQGALAVPGVSTAQTFELTDANGLPAKYVQLFITDAYTDSLAQLAVVPPTYQTQSQVLALNVFNALSNVRGGGIYVFVQVAQVVLQPVNLNLSFTATANTLPGGIDGVAQRARAAVVNYTNNLTSGSTWSRAAAQAQVALIPGLQITGNEIASPTGDVIPTPLQALRTTFALVLTTALGTGVALQASINPDTLTA